MANFVRGRPAEFRTFDPARARRSPPPESGFRSAQPPSRPRRAGAARRRPSRRHLPPGREQRREATGRAADRHAHPAPATQPQEAPATGQPVANSAGRPRRKASSRKRFSRRVISSPKAISKTSSLEEDWRIAAALRSAPEFPPARPGGAPGGSRSFSTRADGHRQPVIAPPGSTVRGSAFRPAPPASRPAGARNPARARRVQMALPARPPGPGPGQDAQASLEHSGDRRLTRRHVHPARAASAPATSGPTVTPAPVRPMPTGPPPGPQGLPASLLSAASALTGAAPALLVAKTGLGARPAAASKNPENRPSGSPAAPVRGMIRREPSRPRSTGGQSRSSSRPPGRPPGRNPGRPSGRPPGGP